MKWGNLNLHIEHLIPGIVTLVLLMPLLDKTRLKNNLLPTAKATTAEKGKTADTSSPFLSFLQKETVAALVFLAIAYMVGLVVFVISRLLVDSASEFLFRPLALYLRCRVTPEGNRFPRPWPWKRQACRQINGNYANAIARGLWCGNEYVQTEIIKRRERGRLARTLLVPLLLIAFYLTTGWWPIVLSLLLVFVVVAVLFAYTEAMIYDECRFMAINPLDQKPEQVAHGFAQHLHHLDPAKDKGGYALQEIELELKRYLAQPASHR